MELLEKIAILKEKLDQLEIIANLKAIQQEIREDQALYEQIKKKESVISNNPKIIEYKRLENQVNFLILEINQYLKENFKKDRNYYESN